MSIDIVDQIDALIDERLSEGEPIGGFDYDDPDYPKCPHCYRDWHGLAITERIEQMRWYGMYDEGYSYAEDDSPVLCPGSTFIGPMPQPQGYDDGSPWLPRRSFASIGSVGLFQQSSGAAWVHVDHGIVSLTALRSLADSLNDTMMVISEVWERNREAIMGVRESIESDRRRSHTPPMWAHDPTRTRRTRNRR